MGDLLMNLKRLKVLNVVLMFLFSFLFHFMYEWFPNFFTSIFFPVNESIWEHMKIIFGSILVVSLVQIVICKYKDIGINNRFLEIICKGVFGIVFYLIVFVSVYLLIGENMFFSIGLMFVIYVVCELLGYKLLKYNDLRYKLSIVLIFSFMLLLEF